MTDQADALRLALSPLEAARALGISRSTLYAEVLPDLRVVKLGTRTLVPISELDAYLKRNAQRSTS